MKIFVKILCAMAVLLPCSCIHDEPTDVEEVVTVGSRLPDFEVTMSDGTIVTGTMLRTTASVVMFFHTSCPDCQQTLPHVQSLYNAYAHRGVQFALISREEERETIAAYWESHGLTMPYSPQSDRRIYELFAYRRVPRIYVTDTDGTVRHIFTDYPAPSYETLLSAVEGVMRQERAQ